MNLKDYERMFDYEIHGKGREMKTAEEKWITDRTKIISKMLDNPDEYGIYPTTICFNELDKAAKEYSDQQAQERYEKAKESPYYITGINAPYYTDWNLKIAAGINDKT